MNFEEFWKELNIIIKMMEEMNYGIVKERLLKLRNKVFIDIIED